MLAGLKVTWLCTSSLLCLRNTWNTALPMSSQFLDKHSSGKKGLDAERNCWDENLGITNVRGCHRDEDLGY